VGIAPTWTPVLSQAYARIVIQEAPAVLATERYREIEEAYPMALLTGDPERPEARRASRFLRTSTSLAAWLTP